MITIILLKMLPKNPQPPSPPKIHSSLKIQKVKASLFWPRLKIFQPPPSPPPCRNGGGGILCCVSQFLFCNMPCSLYILSHENKKASSPFYHKKMFLIENEYKTSSGCLTFIFCQKYLLGFSSLLGTFKYSKKFTQYNNTWTVYI